VRSLLSRVAEAVGFSGELIEGVRLEGETVAVAVVVDKQELARRNEVGLGAVRNRSLLTALGSLPLGYAIEWTSIDPAQWPILDAAPRGVLSTTELRVTRLWQPAIAVTGVLKVSASWEAGSRVGLFNPDAPTVAVLRGVPRRLDSVLHEASRFGIGVALAAENDVLRLVQLPKPRPHRQTVRHWRFLEDVFHGWQAHQASAAQART